ncbi:MAG: RDD family protein [Thermodesulfobacteriota bacterium]
MKCPSCGYNTFDTYERCKRCGALFSGRQGIDRAKVLNDSGEDKGKTQDFDSNKLFDEHQVPLDTDDDPIVLENEIVEESNENYNLVSESAKQHNIIDQQSPDDSFLTLASFTSRFFAFLIDIILIILISFVTLIFGLFAAGYDPIKGMINLSFILLPVYIILTLLATTYLLFLHAYSGKTVGKVIFGIRVVREDGSSINLSDSFIRWIGYYISALPLFYGYFSAIFDLNYQTWHDKISKSYVIKDN